MSEKLRVIVHNDTTDAMTARLQEIASDVDVLACHSNAELDAAIGSFRPDVVYSVRFEVSQPFPRDSMLGETGPRWISVGGSGCDHLGKWDTERVTVTNSAGVASAMMAEFVLGCALHFTLDIPRLQADKADKTWPIRMVSPLNGKTLLIVGLGQTGQAVAARAKAFGMRVLGTRARPSPVENVDEVYAADDLPKLWAQADFICVCVPLLASTRGLIDQVAFDRMKSSAILIDVSRGGVIVSNAAIQAMNKGKIKGAAFDVFATEPLPPDSPYWDLPNTLISPHCSAVYEGWDLASFDMFLANLERWQTGQTLTNIVDPNRGY
ncbi:D-2-hydroxyacid dehydrogenase [Roseovarius phycicola]|uniref:D-2-hydroxyacid dehydrogenase n=1 Tax=Roseovarius phycicola TaxID=3080976 RepID=A0ABZ2HHU1_9RHOB